MLHNKKSNNDGATARVVVVVVQLGVVHRVDAQARGDQQRLARGSSSSVGAAGFVVGQDLGIV